MTELLVVIACLYDKGCSNTASVYYQQNPQLQQFLEVTERKVRATVGSAVVDYWVPAVAFGAGREASIGITSTLTIRVSRQSTLLAYSKGF